MATDVDLRAQRAAAQLRAAAAAQVEAHVRLQLWGRDPVMMGLLFPVEVWSQRETAQFLDWARWVAMGQAALAHPDHVVFAQRLLSGLTL